MVVLDFSIVNVALPSIERELHMPADAVQWIVTGYAISFGGLLILGGRAADLLGRRRMFVAGLIAFSLASLAGGLAQDPVLLIAARVVQGAGAAIVAPAALSLITTGFPEGPERTRAIGLYGAVSSVGFVSGQVLGGVLVQFTSWRCGVPGQRPGRPDRRRPGPGHPRPRQDRSQDRRQDRSPAKTAAAGTPACAGSTCAARC